MQVSSWGSQEDSGLLQELSPLPPPDSLSVRLGMLLKGIILGIGDIHCALKMVWSVGEVSMVHAINLLVKTSRSEHDGKASRGKKIPGDVQLMKTSYLGLEYSMSGFLKVKRYERMLSDEHDR